jgi:hypothetical protein
MSDRTLRALLSALLVMSAALFAVGVAIERHDTSHENHGAAHAAAPGTVLVADADQGRGEHPLGGRTSSSGGHAERHASNQSAAAPARETGAERRSETHGAARRESPAQLARERGSERVFGIDTESSSLVASAVAVSLVLAIALWLRAGVLVPLGIVGFAVAAAVFDVREVFHQIDESRTNLAVIAALVALLHTAAAACAVALARRHSVGGRMSPADQQPTDSTTQHGQA